MTQGQKDRDEKFIRRCIDLADKAVKMGDLPFGSVVVLDDKIISEGYNEAFNKKEVCRHAEMVALIDAQKKLNEQELSKSTIYSSVEPCPMCSFAIRELKIKRIVFGLHSPFMGGYTRWDVLKDTGMSTTLSDFFGKPPTIQTDVLKEEVKEGWKRWNKDLWERFETDGIFQ